MGQDDIAVKQVPVKIFRMADKLVAVISDNAHHIGVEVVVGEVT